MTAALQVVAGGPEGPGYKHVTIIMITPTNLIRAGTADDTPGECESVEPLLTRPGLLLERIISRGCATPAGEWYDQERDEWVMLVTGNAVLAIDGQRDVALQAGDHVLLPAHVRHRVEQVSSDAVWLALHVSPEPSPELCRRA